MNEQIADLRRRIDNLLRLGTVTEVRAGACRVKTGNITTAWRPWFTTRAGSARTSWRPTVGEQVMLLSLSGDLANAYVLPALYQDAMPEPDDHPTRDRTVYPDGAVIEYDPEAGALRAVGINTALVQAAEHVTVDCPQTTCTGNVTVEGVLTYRGGLNNQGSSSGATIVGPVTITGPVTINGTLVNNGINLTTHTHPGYNGTTTGGPQ